MAVKTFTAGEVLTASDTNTYLANAGLVHIKTATVTNAADSGTTWQSIFTSTYDSYRMVCHTLNAHTNGSQPRFQWLYGTTTAQATTYYSSTINAFASGGTSVTAVNNGAYVAMGPAADSIAGSSFVIDFMQCGYSARANCVFIYQDNYDGAFCSGGALVGTTRTYDGVKFYMAAGNISMTASVYGYRKA